MPIAAIRAALEETHSWDASTVKTLLRRLREKGAVDCEKRDVFYYWPLLGRKDYPALVHPVLFAAGLSGQRPGPGGGAGGVLSP